MMKHEEVYQQVKVSRTVYSGDKKLWEFTVTIMDVDEEQALARAARILNKNLAAVNVGPLETERVP